jgi:hypothetical protein
MMIRSSSFGEAKIAVERIIADGVAPPSPSGEPRRALDVHITEAEALLQAAEFRRAPEFARDVALGLALRCLLSHEPNRRIADLGVWRAVAVNVVPDLVWNRHSPVTEKHFSDPRDCYPLRCWRFVDLCWQENGSPVGSLLATVRAVKGLTTDAISALVERPGSGAYAGYRSDVTRELVRQFALRAAGAGIRREGFFRQCAKLCHARMLLEEPALSEGGVRGFVTSLFDGFGTPASVVTMAGAEPRRLVAPKPAAKATPKTAAEAAIQPVAKNVAKIAARPAARPVASSASRSTAKPASTPDVKTLGKVPKKASTRVAAQPSLSRQIRLNPSVRKTEVARFVAYLVRWLSRQKEPQAKADLISRATLRAKEIPLKLSRADLDWLWDNGLRAELQAHEGVHVSGTTRGTFYQRA